MLRKVFGLMFTRLSPLKEAVKIVKKSFSKIERCLTKTNLDSRVETRKVRSDRKKSRKQQSSFGKDGRVYRNEQRRRDKKF